MSTGSPRKMTKASNVARPTKQVTIKFVGTLKPTLVISVTPGLTVRDVLTKRRHVVDVRAL